MNISTQRFLDRYAGQVLCAGLSVWRRIFGERLENNSPVPTSIAILMLSEMGSMVLALPMVQELKKRYPQARLHIVQLGKNQEIARLLGFDPKYMHALDDRSVIALLSSFLQVIRDLRRDGVDTVIDCELFARVSAVIAGLVGARYLAGFTRHTQEGLYRGSFFNCAIPYNPYRPITRQFLALIDAVKSMESSPEKERVRSHLRENAATLLAASASTFPRNKIAPSPEYESSKAADAALVERPLPAPPLLRLEANELSQAVERLNADFPSQQGRPLVLIYPGGGLLPIRAWSEENFAQTAKTLIADGASVGFIGLKDDCALAVRLQQAIASPFALNLTGYTQSIRALMVLFFHAKLLITNDGGPGHFAALTPIASILLFGPETPLLYAPLGTRSVSLYAPTPCSPCLTAYNHRNSFCDGNNQCLKNISVATVLTHARMALNNAL